jgi:Ran GTPase-activating protein 1
MVNFLTNNRTLQVLKLNNNGLGVWGGTTVANALLESARLSKAAGTPSNLRVVVCGRNRLENGSAPHWAEAFAAHGGLREVRMPQNGIRMEGFIALAKGLSGCHDLESLDLQDNTATEKGSRAIAVALPSWPKLHTLNLSDCLLSSKGGIAIATALSKGASHKLEALRLQYGELDKRVFSILAQAIADHLPNLKTLELNGNIANAEDESIQGIRDALAKHGHEHALDELDDMEEQDEDEDEGDDAATEEEDEKDEEVLLPPSISGPAPATHDPTDELSSLMGSININAV